MGFVSGGHFIENLGVWVTWEKAGKAFVSKESQLSMTINFSEMKFGLSLETLEEYEVLNSNRIATNSSLAIQ